MKNILPIARVALVLLAGTGLARAQFTAYNDHYQGPSSHPNATFWNVFGTAGAAPGNSGPLKDITTGANVPVTLTINNVNVGTGSTSGAPDPGTPAYNLFLGFIDWGSGTLSHAPYTAPGNSATYVFSGMDPTKRYSFKGTAARGGGYADRWETFELQGASSFVSAHTSGCLTNNRPDVPGVSIAANQAVVNTGANTVGDYADWESIDPGPDGTITIVASLYTGPLPGGLSASAAVYSYTFTAIRLQEFVVAPVPAQITADPRSAEILEGTATNFTVTVLGNPPPVLQWYLNGAVVPGATNASYQTPVAQIADSGAVYQVVASNMVGGVPCLATSAPAVLTVRPDAVAPGMISQYPPPGAQVRELRTIEVAFSEGVSGVDAWDLLINGLPASNMVVLTPSQYRFEFTAPATGAVQVAWAPVTGIKDLASTPNAFPGGNWSYTYDPNLPLTGVIVINEFMASNKSGIRDEDGDHSDWIELYNNSDMAVNLLGWGLTDDANNLLKWQFPAVMLPSKGYIYVFASGKNKVNPAARMHTSFQLNKGGDFLAVSSPQGYVADSFTPVYPVQQDDVSYGRARGDLSSFGYFNAPTPGTANSTSGAGFAPDVVLSRASGSYVEPFLLTLSTPASPGAEIRYVVINTAYTANNTNVPSATSTLYTGPIGITNAVQVIARAYQTGLLPGQMKVGNYIQLTGAVTNYSSDLPFIVLHTLGTATVSGGYPTPRTGLILEIHDTVNGRSSMTNKPDLVHRAGISIRGSSTGGNPKSSWALETWDEYNNDEKVSVLGMPAESDWVLYAPNVFDQVLINNPLAQAIRRQMEPYSSRTRFVEVFFNNTGTPLSAATNSTGAGMGNYWGVYVVEEKIKQGPDRVNVHDLPPEVTNAPAITGGYMFKRDRSDANERTFAAANDTLVYLYPDGLEMVTAARKAQADYVTAYFNSFWAALNSASWTNPVTGYAAYIDVDAWLNHHIHDVMTLNVDGLRLSGYLYKERGRKLAWGPAWDFDRTMGCSGSGDTRSFSPLAWMSANNQGGGADYGTDFFNANPATYNNPWFAKLFQDPDFWQAWIDRYQQLRRTVFTTNNIWGIIDQMGGQLRQAQPREVARWGGNGASSTTPRAGAVSVAGGVHGAYSYTFPGTFQGELDFKKKWWADRIRFVDTNLLNAPSIGLAGGAVAPGALLTLADNSGKAGTTLYYTTDGTDPRGAGGNISPRATAYTGPVALNANARVVVRAMNPAHRNMSGNAGPTWGNPPISSPWSSPAADTFYMSTPTLVVTEIMYHPGNAPAGNTNDPANFEYIELKNVGGAALNLIGFRFTNGVYYTFTAASSVTNLAPGGYVLLVRNRAAFLSRYPGTTNIAGEFLDASGQPGSLNNGGERLVLVGPVLEPVLDFSYNNSWLPLTDGAGFSLTIANDGASHDAWTNASSWRLSGADGGTPGAADTALAPVSPVLVNEVLSHSFDPLTDTIELFNPGAAAVNIGGWFLSDDFQTPKKYRIADGTMIDAGGFALFTQPQFGAGANGFGLNSKGDNTFLFSADASTNLTGYYHGFGFGAGVSNRTFGRYVLSTGQEDSVLQKSNTLGSVNSGPQVGPVVINEIMFQPPDIQDGTNWVDDTDNEYIELRNITSQPVSLFDVYHPSNTWKIRGGVDYLFPLNTVIPAGGYALIVNFDPATDAVKLAGFAARYHVDPLVTPLFGPYQGKLNNGGDNVELALPNPPLTSPAADVGFVPYVQVDKVSFLPASPWPCGSGNSGNSLQRFDSAAYGNDPINWVATLPTPGLPTPNITPGLPTIVNQPRTITTPTNTSVQFSVSACGVPPYFYQWFKDGSALSGAVNSTLSLSSVQLADAGVYTVTISNSAGVVLSEPAHLYVQVPPLIVNPPISLTATAFSRVSFSVQAGPTPPFQFQWRFAGVAIPGATNGELVIPNVQPEQEGDYSVLVVNTAGSIVSSAAHLTLQIPAHVVSQPLSMTVLSATSNAFVATVIGSRPITYQWFYNGAPIAGTLATITGGVSSPTNILYRILSAATNQNGAYTVALTNQYGWDVSQPALFTVSVKPQVVQQPPHLLASPGETVVMTATASGTQPMFARWRKSAGTMGTYVQLPGNTASLVLSKLSLTNLGGYDAVFTNYLNKESTAQMSQRGYLTMVKPPPATRLGPEGSTVALSAIVNTATTNFYSWEFNGATLARGSNVLSGSTVALLTTNTLSLSNLSDAQLGTYTYWVTNYGRYKQTNDSVVSTNWIPQGEPRSFDVTVGFGIQIDPPVVVISPTNRTVLQGASTNSVVVAAGSMPVTYQWFRDTELVFSTNSSSTTNALSLPSIQPGEAGDYFVTVSNAAGVVTSDVATITVLWAPVINTQPQSMDAFQGGLAVFSVAADGTAPLRYQWHRETIRLANETNSTVQVFNVQATNLGRYWVSITNNYGWTTSQLARLSFPTAPTVVTQPVSVAVAAGATATFTVGAAGSQPFTYQWYFGETPVSGGIDATLSLPGVQPDQAGGYKVIVANSAGSVTSSVATLTVTAGAAPQIDTQPADLVAIAGRTAAFSVAVSGGGPYTYQWYKDGALLGGSIDPTLTLPNVQPLQAGGYQVIVANPSGSVTSRVAQLSILVGPSIVTSPTNQTVAAGSTVTFTVLASGTAPLAYQWLFNGLPIIPAQTGTELVLNNVQTAQAGAYSVLVSNLAGPVMSGIAMLTVQTPPSMTRQPTNYTAIAGSTASFNAAASGTAPLRFQWLFEGAPLSGQTASILTLPIVQPSQAGGYSVIITNAAGSVTSVVARLTVLVFPSVVEEPASTNVLPGATAKFEVRATGSDPLSYQWWFQSTNLLVGQTASILEITNVQAAQAGAYDVVITNAAGSTRSAAATLSVVQPPQILTQPTNLWVVAPGVQISLEATASGTGPLHFQWWFNGTNALAYGAAGTLVLTNVQAASEGFYHVVVTNGAGSASSQPSRVLLTTTDTDGDGSPDWQELLAGTDPADPASFLRVAVAGGASGGVVVSFAAVSNKTYTVVYTAELPAASWTSVLAQVPSAPTNRIVEIPDTAAGPEKRFYRLVTPRLP